MSTFNPTQELKILRGLNDADRMIAPRHKDVDIKALYDLADIQLPNDAINTILSPYNHKIYSALWDEPDVAETFMSTENHPVTRLEGLLHSSSSFVKNEAMTLLSRIIHIDGIYKADREGAEALSEKLIESMLKNSKPLSDFNLFPSLNHFSSALELVIKKIDAVIESNHGKKKIERSGMYLEDIHEADVYKWKVFIEPVHDLLKESECKREIKIGDIDISILPYISPNMISLEQALSQLDTSEIPIKSAKVINQLVESSHSKSILNNFDGLMHFIENVSMEQNDSAFDTHTFNSIKRSIQVKMILSCRQECEDHRIDSILTPQSPSTFMIAKDHPELSQYIGFKKLTDITLNEGVFKLIKKHISELKDNQTAHKNNLLTLLRTVDEASRNQTKYDNPSDFIRYASSILSDPSVKQMLPLINTNSGSALLTGTNPNLNWVTDVIKISKKQLTKSRLDELIAENESGMKCIDDIITINDAVQKIIPMISQKTLTNLYQSLDDKLEKFLPTVMKRMARGTSIDSAPQRKNEDWFEHTL
jgi:hypothetical protein